MKYAYQDLSDDQFEQLVVLICQRLLGMEHVIQHAVAEFTQRVPCFGRRWIKGLGRGGQRRAFVMSRLKAGPAGTAQARARCPARS